MRDRSGFKFDLLTRRFLTGRWKPLLGERVLKEIVEALEAL